MMSSPGRRNHRPQKGYGPSIPSILSFLVAVCIASTAVAQDTGSLGPVTGIVEGIVSSNTSSDAVPSSASPSPVQFISSVIEDTPPADVPAPSEPTSPQSAPLPVADVVVITSSVIVDEPEPAIPTIPTIPAIPAIPAPTSSPELFEFPVLPPSSEFLSSFQICRDTYDDCMDSVRDCLQSRDDLPDSDKEPVRLACESYREDVCENGIRVQCDGLSSQNNNDNNQEDDRTDDREDQDNNDDNNNRDDDDNDDRDDDDREREADRREREDREREDRDRQREQDDRNRREDDRERGREGERGRERGRERGGERERGRDRDRDQNRDRRPDGGEEITITSTITSSSTSRTLPSTSRPITRTIISFEAPIPTSRSSDPEPPTDALPDGEEVVTTVRQSAPTGILTSNLRPTPSASARGLILGQTDLEGTAGRLVPFGWVACLLTTGLVSLIGV